MSDEDKKPEEQNQDAPQESDAVSEVTSGKAVDEAPEPAASRDKEADKPGFVRSYAVIFLLAALAFAAGLALWPEIQTQVAKYLPIATAPAPASPPAAEQPPARPAAKAPAPAVASLERAVTGSLEDLSNLRQRLEKVETGLAKLQAEIDHKAPVHTVDTTAELKGDLDQLAERVGLLGEELKELADAPPPAPAVDNNGAAAVAARDDVRLADLEERLARMTQLLTQMQEHSPLKTALAAIDELKAASARQTEENAALKAKLAVLEEAQSLNRSLGQRDAAALAIAELGIAMERGASTSAALTALSTALMDQADLYAEINQLKSHLKTPLYSWEKLERAFNQALREALAGGDGQDEGLWPQLRNKLTAVISIRRTGEVSGDGLDAVLARAEAAMADRDLARCLKELEALPATAQGAFQLFLNEASRRQQADQALSDLRNRAISALAGQQ